MSKNVTVEDVDAIVLSITSMMQEKCAKFGQEIKANMGSTSMSPKRIAALVSVLATFQELTPCLSKAWDVQRAAIASRTTPDDADCCDCDCDTDEVAPSSAPKKSRSGKRRPKVAVAGVTDAKVEGAV